MAQRNQLTIQPPIGGVNKRAGFQSQPPFTAYRAINAWPTDPLTGRSVTGTRPAIAPFATPGAPVNMLVRVNGVATGKPLQSMLAAENGEFHWYNSSGTWTAATMSVATTLAEVVDASETEIDVTDASVFGFTSGNSFYVSLESDLGTAFNEIVLVTNVVGNTLTVTRAQLGTSAQPTSNGNDVKLIAESDTALFPATFLQEVFIPRFGYEPLVFNYGTGAVQTLVETAGTVPTDLRMFVVWQGALWGAGRLAAPHILYASRVGDAYDWDFAAAITDTAGAFFTAGENEGRLRGPITALMPQTSDTMIVSTTEGLVAMRAHPRDGGVFEDIGATYVLGQGAWCKLPGDVLFFMTRLGMYTMAPGQLPLPVSPKAIPDDLIGLAYDYEDPRINMEYDSRFNGIWITVRDDTEPQAWFYDLVAGGFHEVTLASYPYRLVEFFEAVTENTSGVLFAGDAYGGLGQPDRVGSEVFEADIIIGPFAVSANPTQATKIVQARVTFGGDTPTVDGTLAFAMGATAEEAVQRADDETHQYSIGLTDLEASNGVCHPHVSGHAGVLRLTYTGGRVTIEEVTLTLVTAGVTRMVKYKTPGVCNGYAEATPTVAPSQALSASAGAEVIDLSFLPAEWWALVNDTGSNIRVTDSDNNFIAFDLALFDKGDETGQIWLNRALPLTPTAVRCWVCNQNVSKFPLGAPFGQYNAYPPWLLAIWPRGIGPSRGAVNWPMTYDFDSLPTNGPIAGQALPAGGGAPETPPSGDERNYIAVTRISYEDIESLVPLVMNRNHPDTAAQEFLETNGVLFLFPFFGLEFANSAITAGEALNESVSFFAAPGSQGSGPGGSYDDPIFRWEKTNGVGVLHHVDSAVDLDTVANVLTINLIRLNIVSTEGVESTFRLYFQETLVWTFTFGPLGEIPNYINWRMLAPNAVGDGLQLIRDAADVLDGIIGGGASQDNVVLRRPEILYFAVTGALSAEDQAALDHLAEQINDLDTYWGDWAYSSAPGTNLDAAN